MIREALKTEMNVMIKSSPADLVTVTDQKVEKMLMSSIKEKYPYHGFIGEESVAAGEKTVLTEQPTWIIDPIDGTTNFVHRLLEELPPLNAAFLRQMFRILNKIARNSSINHMPAYSLSAAIAPFLLCLPRYGNKVLATDISKKISLVTFLIDNSPKLFGLDIVALWYETSFYHGPGGNTSCDQVTTSNIITRNEPEHGASSCPKGRTYTPDHDEPAISQVAPPLSEGTNESETQEDNMNATQQTTSQTPTAPPKNQVFRTCPRFICLDKMLPSILDMISVIAEKGPESEEVFQSISDRSHLVLRDKIYTEQHINWDQESVLTVAYLLKVRQYFASPTFSIPLEMHILSLRLPDHDSFLELWIHDLRIRVTLGKSVTSSKIHHKDTGEHFLLEVNFLIHQMGFFGFTNVPTDFTSLTIPPELIIEKVIIVIKVCFTRCMS
ncbi:uncharacterized protein LOC127683531 isoform X4 [Apodemus sylvaticus]|nr:uncharacterized protein LOC127683531 isoform X4 [Apodemus sylvaticus]